MSSHRLLGYWLEGTGVRLFRRPTVEYRGLDRLIAIPIPGPQDYGELVAQGRSSLVDTTEAYQKAREDFRLNTDRDTAFELRDRLSQEGMCLEVIFAEVLSVPKLPGRDSDLEQISEQQFRYWERVHNHFDGIDFRSGLTPMGIDVTYPHPSFHSAIFHGNLDDSMPGYESHLNEFGLFPDDESIADIVRDLNVLSDYSLRPFCPVLISSVSPP